MLLLRLLYLLILILFLQNPSMATPLSSALHLCKRIREEYSHISVGQLCPLAINRQQCMLLSDKVLEAENTLKPIQVKLSQQDTTSSGFPNVGPATEELVHVLRAAHTTIFKDCFCNGKWMESTLRQGGELKETFAEILYDLQWCMMVLRSIFQDSRTPPNWLLQQVDCDRNLSERDNDSLLKAAKLDQKDLKVRLGNLKGDHACHGERCTGMDINMQCLASQLLNKMEFEEEFQAWPTQEKKNYLKELYKVNGIKLTKWPFVVLANLQDLHKGVLLGEGSFGRVYEAKWLAESFAMKIPKHPSTELLKQEIAAVAGVHHPHIMGLVFCAEDAKNSVYVMERMDKSLSQMLTDQSNDSQPSLIRRVGVMLQIAEGMKYLHSKGLVHRDLKTDNILIKCDGPGSESSMLDLAVKPLWIAKISDFGTTKVIMDSTTYANQTMNTGTTMFMAPEMYEVQRADQLPERCHPKMADVYSFGLICFAVLIGEPTPFPVDELLTPTVFKNRVREGKRPQLPHYCPSQLSNLIQQCWDGNPDERPNFQEICTKLRHIKGLLLTEGSSPDPRLPPRDSRLVPETPYSSRTLDSRPGTPDSSSGLSTRLGPSTPAPGLSTRLGPSTPAPGLATRPWDSLLVPDPRLPSRDSRLAPRTPCSCRTFRSRPSTPDWPPGFPTRPRPSAPALGLPTPAQGLPTGPRDFGLPPWDFRLPPETLNSPQTLDSRPGTCDSPPGNSGMEQTIEYEGLARLLHKSSLEGGNLLAPRVSTSSSTQLEGSGTNARQWNVRLRNEHNKRLRNARNR